jgi:hypothetical protein
MNKILVFFDLLMLPVTVMRMIIIYFFGSRYNINGFEFLDIMNHSEKRFFNQEDDNPKVDLINKDLRECIYESSKLYIESLDPQVIQTNNSDQSIPNIRIDTNDIKQNDNNDANKYINLLNLIIESANENIVDNNNEYFSVLNTEFTDQRDDDNNYYEENNNNTEMIDLDEDIILINKKDL